MFQREVAERICAQPGEDPYGRLGVLAGWRSEARIAFNVGRQAFVPQPNVTSAVVYIKPKAVDGTGGKMVRDLENVTKAAFGQRRKMVRQSGAAAEVAWRAGGGPAGGGGSARATSGPRICRLRRSWAWREHFPSCGARRRFESRASCGDSGACGSDSAAPRKLLGLLWFGEPGARPAPPENGFPPARE
jgi:hypothetical protein